VWLTLVSTELAMLLKLRIYACYQSFDHTYQCLIAYFITTMLHRDRELFSLPNDWKTFPKAFYKNFALVGDGEIPQEQLISIPAAEWVEGYYYTDPEYQTSVPMETLFGNRANQDVFFPRVSQFKF
jgi:hypothetical protein